jgi:uncharacterized protein (TIGR03118 family)
MEETMNLLTNPLIRLCTALVLLSPATFAQNSYKRVNLVSDQHDVALRYDPNLINPWGLVIRDHSTVAIAENGDDRMTLRTRKGRLKRAPISLPGGAATGLTQNSGGDFVITDGDTTKPARLILATEGGFIMGWNPELDRYTAFIAVDNSSSNAVYTGATIGHTGGQDYLYVANFHAGVVEMYDAQFGYVKTITDATIPAGFAPFNVRVLRDKLFVTYAKQLAPANLVDEPGDGNGYVNIFDLDGTFIRRFAAGGVLNSPWGIARAPENGFTRFNDDVLIGNHGDGRINGFDPQTGEFLAPVRRANGDPIEIDGLWGLAFGVRKLDNCCGFFELVFPTLYFTAGPGGGAHGLFGYIRTDL